MLAEPKPNAHQDPLRAYVESVMLEAGFRDLSPEMRADLTASLMHEAERRVGLELMRATDERTLGEFEALVHGGASDAEVAAFFSVRMPDVRDRVKVALSDFSTECLRQAEAFRRGDG